MTAFLDHPREPLRPVVDTPTALAECLAALKRGSGEVAFDAERAHGHRYWPKAYLFQIRREGGGTWLIDPVAFEADRRADLTAVARACGDATWLLHAATQDLPCMAEVGIYPQKLFDTELAARLLGESQVSLAALLDSKLGLRLKKAHSAANWASRPLPESWLTYAALDVDYLTDLAAVLREELDSAGRRDWAEQEFTHILTTFATPPEPRAEPWRRLSGLQGLRTAKQLAIARALWEERDRIAQSLDRPPGRIVPDSAIVEVASLAVKDGPFPNGDDLRGVPGFQQRGAQRYRTNWVRTLADVAALEPSQYPNRRESRVGFGHPRTWARSNPAAAERWRPIRAAVDELAASLRIQASLVAPPTILQELAYRGSLGDVAAELGRAGARPWQVELVAPVVVAALQTV